MAAPLKKTYSPRHPYVVERHDEDDGAIVYEIWDQRPKSYRRLCSLHEWYDGGAEDDCGRVLSTAKSDAELICCALNYLNDGPS